MSTLFYYPEKEQPNPRKGPISFNGIDLKPGFNELSEAQIVALTKHPDYDAYVEWGAISYNAEQVPLFLVESQDPRAIKLDSSASIADNISIEEPKPRRGRKPISQEEES